MPVKAILFVATVVATTLVGIAQEPPSWVKTEKTDPLRRLNFSQFRLGGKYLTYPKGAEGAEPSAAPAIIVRCESGSYNFGKARGKFLDGYIFVGSVVDVHVSGDSGATVIAKYRLDDGKLQTAYWTHSTDFSSIFFDSAAFNNLLYGHLLPHKEDTGPQVRKIMIGVPEFLGGEIVMEFEMPDANEVTEMCGVLWHKHRE